MKRQPEQIDELSKAVRDLRTAMGLTQQEFANRVQTAIRTITRWEHNQPPHGRALVQLAQIAEARELKPIAAKFVQALECELASPHARGRTGTERLAGRLADRVSVRPRRMEHWQEIAKAIIDAVEFAVTDKVEVGDKENSELLDLYRQLRERYREDFED